MGFRLRIDMHIPDQDCPNALTQEQQDVIERFRRDIIGAQFATVSVRDDAHTDETGLGWEALFTSGSQHRAEQPSA